MLMYCHACATKTNLKVKYKFWVQPWVILIPKGVLLTDLAQFGAQFEDGIKASLRRQKNAKSSQLLLTKRYLSLLWRQVSWKNPADAWDSSGGKLHEIKKIISPAKGELVLAGAGVKTWPQAALTFCPEDAVARTFMPLPAKYDGVQPNNCQSL